MKTLSGKILWLGFALALLSGCGPRLAKGSASLELTPPDSLKAKFSLEINDSLEGSHTLSAVLFAVPYKRYRMEFSGPMGIGVASVLWQDAKWTLVLPQQKSFAVGSGFLVGGYAGIPLLDIHQIAGLFWGEVLPFGSSVDSLRDSLDGKILYGKNRLGIPFEAFRNKDGRIVKIVQAHETLEFSNYAEFDSVEAPEWTRVFRKGKNVLSIKIKRVNTDVRWGDEIWRVPVPESYQKMGF